MLTQKILKKFLDYNPETGVFVWKVSTSKKIKPGDIAGSESPSGYITIRLNHKYYLAHRLAWFYVNGEFPGIIDHIDRVKNNNRINNLRESTAQQNQANRTKTKSNKTGYKGVSFISKVNKYRADIKINKKCYYLGLFNTLEEAAEAYNKKAAEAFGKFASLNIIGAIDEKKEKTSKNRKANSKRVPTTSNKVV